MSTKVYSINELVGFAVQIEKQGQSFYQAMADKTKSKEAKAIYQLLKEEELKHEKGYQSILDQLDQAVNAGGDYGETYQQYLHAMVETTVFNPNEVATVAKISNDSEAIDYAIGKEKESILFYVEMQKFVSGEFAEIVADIISEEQMHIIKLLNIKEQVG